MKYCAVVGEPIDALPIELQSTLKSSMNLNYYAGDLSILSDPNDMGYLFIIKEDKDIELLSIAVKIATNLNKLLIICHSSNIGFDAQSELHRYINIDSNQANIQLLALLKDENESTISVNNKALKRFDINEVLSFIDNNITFGVNETDVAEHSHLSISYFSKLFHDHVGMSFQEYICSSRIELAKRQLLSNRQLSISNIAYDLGYKDVSYFSRQFKKHTGCTPSAFRVSR